MRVVSVDGRLIDLPKPNYINKLRNADQVMNIIRWEMYYYDAKDISKSIGKSLSCIHSIRSGRTKWPRGETFFALIDFLGLTMELKR